MPGWVAMVAKKGEGGLLLRSQYHRRREGRGDQDGKSSETTYMCPWYSVERGN